MTLLQMVILMCFVSMPSAACGIVTGAGGGILRYAISILLGLSLGSAIAWADWRAVHMLGRRADQFPKRTQTLVTIAFIPTQIAWFLFSIAAGFGIGFIVVHHVTR
jgi:hypothetical protein